MISETKIDESFPISQFLIDGFSSPYRLDRNSNGGGILVYFKNNIITKSLKTINLSIEAIFIEMNLRSKKWLLCFTYNPSKSLLERHLNQIQAQLDIFCKNYEHLLILGDFNANISEPALTSFCTLFKLKNLVKEPTCYKNPNNPSCIDLFLTNCARSFHNTCVFETGLSDFHKLVVTLLRSKVESLPPKIISYRTYKQFNQGKFKDLFLSYLNELEMSDLSLDVFKMTFLNALNSFAPVKKKYLRANHSKFVNKELSKATMLRTKLRNKFLKQKTTETRSGYNKQRNVCVSILRKAKRSYFENLDIKNLSDNRKFWGTVKPLFSNKVRSNDYITLNENDLLIRNEYEIANIFNTFFVNTVPNLGIEIDQKYLSNVSNISDPVEKAIKKYQKHPSISIINKVVSSVENEASFSLTCVTVDDISKEVKRHDIKKATQESDIPTKVIKQFPNLFIDFLHKNINSCLTEGTFPNDFKKAVVHPIHKKECKTEKPNYRPISILPNLSKIYEILLYDQMYSYFDTFFVKYQCGFRKGYNAQHCLLVMIEKMKEARDKNKVCAAVLTDLSKVFDCLIHDLLIAKPHAFGFDYKSLRVMYAYLNNRVRVTKVGS